MRIIKELFTEHCYVIGNRTSSESTSLKEWLDKNALDKWQVEGGNIIRILDPKVETMFALKWVTK